MLQKNEVINAIASRLAGLGVSAGPQGCICITRCDQPVGKNVADYADLATLGTWEEAISGGLKERKTAIIWTRAIQKALDENAVVRICDTGEPYYIDAPLVMKSGRRLIVDEKAELRLKPGTSTCMVRNENQTSGKDGEVSPTNPDMNITIDGGIWTTLAINDYESNGNLTGGPDGENAINGHGVILLNNAQRVTVHNVTIRECRPHGIQMSNVSEFLIENIRFENHGRDGVHINGPTSFGIVRNISGVTWDDMIALNAWDWKHTCMAFGPIHHILIEDVHAGAPGLDYRAHMRLLGGTKHFDDGGRVDCDISDIVVRDVSNVGSFKMYDQPNLELGRMADFAEPIGSFRNLYFSDIVVSYPSEHTFPIGSNVDGLNIENVTMILKSPESFAKLVHVGPLSATFKANSEDPAKWVEIFSPDKDCTVHHLRLSSINLKIATAERGVVKTIKPRDCIDVVAQKVNPDYPRTTPRGGTGRGILIDD